MDALNEGLNVPKVFGAICASGVSVALTNFQQLGRIIRPEEGKTPIFFNLYTENTVERSWVEKKLKKVESTWLNHLEEIPSRMHALTST